MNNLINQHINQSINELMNHFINQQINQGISIYQPTDQKAIIHYNNQHMLILHEIKGTI